MKERPILFSAPMVRAILEGRKTQTRRKMKSQPYTLRTEGFGYPTKAGGFVSLQSEHCFNECPYGKPGDRLWVREAWGCAHTEYKLNTDVGWYYADGPEPPFQTGPLFKKRPASHMPRWASRITLEITEVRVQRLQEISEEDAIGEGAPRGCEPNGDGTYKLTYTGRHRWGFQYVWESIHGPGSWDANPWVWAISFQRVAEVPATA